MLIGICGNIGTGKTTVANYLVEKYGFIEYSFSSPLKKIGEIFGFTKEELYGTQLQKSTPNKILGISSREFLQKFGTEFGREMFSNLFPNFNIEYGLWIDIFKRQYDPSKNVVVSDIRFKNEEECIRRLGGIIIRTHRTIRPFLAESLHASEQEIVLLKYDYFIDNDLLTKEEAQEKIDIILKKKD